MGNLQICVVSMVLSWFSYHTTWRMYSPNAVKSTVLLTYQIIIQLQQKYLKIIAIFGKVITTLR